MFDVVVLVGSLRRQSWTRKLALALPALSPAQLSLRLEEIGDLPLYNEDFETDIPPPWDRLRADIASCHAALFLTPEYNRSIPAALKNAIDVGSRPSVHNVWRDKPCAIISISQGAMGGFGANHHLRQALVGVGARALAGPEAYIGHVATLFDANGNIAVPDTRRFLSDFLASFAQMIQLLEAAR